MPGEHMKTLADLKKAWDAGNPVNIAGYGRETTHKGYLSWMLNERRWNRAGEAVRALCKAAGAPLGSGAGIKDVTTDWEYRLASRRKVDLLTTFTLNGKPMAIPIELKTDRGPSGEDQLMQMSQGTVGGATTATRIAMTLGAACVQRIKLGAFKRLGPRDVLKALGPLGTGAPEFVRDWLQAVETEAARRDLAMAMYKCPPGPNASLWDHGYRAGSHVLYYVFDHVREHLRTAAPQLKKWNLYSGGYNAVLNLETAPHSWVKLKGMEVSAFFEFNDRWFVLKIQNKEKRKPVVRKLIADLRNDIAARPLSGIPKTEHPRSNKLDSTWLSVARWHFDLDDTARICRDVPAIVKGYGRPGVLAKYV